MDLSTLWWSAVGLTVLAELLSGTFFLLMLALGLVAGALAAHAGLALPAQLVLAGLTGGGAVLGWHLWLQRHRRPEPGLLDEGRPLDQGAIVQVECWNPDGTAEVHHRGARWTAQLPPGAGAPQPGLHRIVGLSGNNLVVEPLPRPTPPPAPDTPSV